MSSQTIAAQLDAINASTAAISKEVAKFNVTVVKAIKGNSRFKDSSVWVKLPSGKFKHLQSGKIAKASRLAGYTEVAYEA